MLRASSLGTWEIGFRAVLSLGVRMIWCTMDVSSGCQGLGKRVPTWELGKLDS